MCRKCDQCRTARRMHWIGRGLAEARFSKSLWMLNLTYRDDVKGSALTYSDVQLMFKRLRKAGFEFTYIVVGEHGSKRGRAHWHVLVFWKGDEPPVEFGKRIQWPFWDHGHSFIERPRSMASATTYVIDYIDKDPNAVFRFSQGLGWEHIRELCDLYLKANRFPFDRGLYFTIEGNKARSGDPFKYWLESDNALAVRALRYCMEHYVRNPPRRLLTLNDALFDVAKRLTKEGTFRDEWRSIIDNAPQHPDFWKETTIAQKWAFHGFDLCKTIHGRYECVSYGKDGEVCARWDVSQKDATAMIARHQTEMCGPVQLPDQCSSSRGKIRGVNVSNNARLSSQRWRTDDPGGLPSNSTGIKQWPRVRPPTWP